MGKSAVKVVKTLSDAEHMVGEADMAFEELEESVD